MNSSSTVHHGHNSSPETSEIPKTRRKRGVQASRNELLKLAKSCSGFGTKMAAKQALQDNGFVSTPAAVEELVNAAAHITFFRANRSSRVFQEHLGYLPTKTYRPNSAHKPVLLPVGTLRERLEDFRKQAVVATARALMRHGATGGHSMYVRFALNASKVNYSVRMDENRNTYGGSFKGWTANEDHHLISVPKDWRIRVERNGLADLGGMLTLDAHPLLGDGDVVLYAATWARQGRGYTINVDRGYIALLDGEHFHGDSAQAAIKGVRRKAKSAEMLPPKGKSPYALTVDSFVARYSGRDMTVSVSDAKESGSCDFGIRSWCEFVGIDYSEGETPMDRVLEGFRKRPQAEVRRAVLFAVRRHRIERQARH